jgi:hypothetical protein
MPAQQPKPNQHLLPADKGGGYNQREMAANKSFIVRKHDITDQVVLMAESASPQEDCVS